MHPSLNGRPSLITEADNALRRELGELAKRHGLRGAVLVTFTSSRVGVNSSGDGTIFGTAMERLGDQILAAIDDGKFDPDPALLEAKASPARASIDQALRALPAGCYWMIGYGHRSEAEPLGACVLFRPGIDEPFVEAEAPTVVDAIAAAAAKAREIDGERQ